MTKHNQAQHGELFSRRRYCRRLSLWSRKQLPTLFGFTLAELLIVLGIIGLIADMTIPNLINSYEKQVTVTKLKKFYVNFNQALTLSRIDNGATEDWEFPTTAYNADQMQAWYNKYMSKYLRTLKLENSSGQLLIYFSDGSMLLLFSHEGGKTLHAYYRTNLKPKKSGKNSFSFYFDSSTNYQMEPYKYAWDKTREGLFTGPYGCKQNENVRHYCTALIQYDNWTIKDDYPWF